jgi:transposase-like protein
VAVKTYSKELKLKAVRRMKTCKTISGFAAELGVACRFLYSGESSCAQKGEEASARRPGQPRSKEQLAASATGRGPFANK